MEITMMDFIGILAIIAFIIITFMVCIAGITITGIFIFKTTEKIIKMIENFFNNL